MERIKEALERARAERSGQPDTASSITAEGHDQIRDVVYSQTRNLDISHAKLRANRIVTEFPQGAFTDAYKMLRTQVLQRLRENDWNVLAVTSPGEGEGKTLTALNLAASMAMEVNHTVLLVDANLRHPSLHELLGLPGNPGLSDYLLNDTPVAELLVHPKGMEHLTVLPAGRAMKNSSEMLNSAKMSRLVEEMKSRYASRIVIFDLPPVLNAADAMAFAPYVDAALLVVEEGKTKQAEVENAMNLLSSTNVLGTVLNKSGRN